MFTEVPKNTAQSFKLYGIGGWLAIYSVLLFVNVVLAGIGILGMLTMGGDLGVIGLALMAVFGAQFFIFYALLKHKSYLPSLVIAVEVLRIIIFCASMFILDQLAVLGVWDIINGLVIPLAWIGYFLRSKRVNATFNSKVPSSFMKEAEETGMWHDGFVFFPFGENVKFADTVFGDLNQAKAHALGKYAT